MTDELTKLRAALRTIADGDMDIAAARALAVEALGSARTPRYGCHVEDDIGEGVDDDCVLDHDRPQDCIYAIVYGKPRENKTSCKWWREIKGRHNG